MKASEIIKKECCGNCYNTLTGKADLIAMVEKLEADKVELINALTFMTLRPFDQEEFVSMVSQCNEVLNRITDG